MTKNVDFALELYYYDHFLDIFTYVSTRLYLHADKGLEVDTVYCYLHTSVRFLSVYNV